MKTIAIINGPNLNLTGVRETAIYGHDSFADFIPKLQEQFEQATLLYSQHNSEKEIIEKLHSFNAENIAGILLNPAAFTHHSVAIADAIRAIKIPVLEVHLSHTAARESFRQQSVTAAACIGCISGLGLQGYLLGVQFFIQKS